ALAARARALPLADPDPRAGGGRAGRGRLGRMVGSRARRPRVARARPGRGRGLRARDRARGRGVEGARRAARRAVRLLPELRLLRGDPREESDGVSATIELAHPPALLALALPVAVLLASRLLDRPPTTAPGPLDAWERVRAASPPAARRARRRIPPAVWALALGLALGAVALAGPRAVAEIRPRRFRVLVDGRPSTGLPLGDSTRIEAAKR